jgi:hypothetical protein
VSKIAFAVVAFVVAAYDAPVIAAPQGFAETYNRLMKEKAERQEREAARAREAAEREKDRQLARDLAAKASAAPAAAPVSSAGLPVFNSGLPVFVLYRSSPTTSGKTRVASFDANEPESDNKKTCETARLLFQQQPGITVGYWCEPK